jgi:hypothetical protein
MAETIVIDNDTQAIYVNGKKWEASPESYMHLRDRMNRHARICQEVAKFQQENPGAKLYRSYTPSELYQSIQAMGGRRA